MCKLQQFSILYELGIAQFNICLQFIFLVSSSVTLIIFMKATKQLRDRKFEESVLYS